MKKLYVWALSAALCLGATACAGKTPPVAPAPAPDHNVSEESGAVTAERLGSVFADLTGYRGTSGTALRNAQNACDLLMFAESADYANISAAVRAEAVSGACAGMDADTMQEFLDDLADIRELMESAFGSEELPGVFADAGAADTMAELLGADDALTQWEALMADLLSLSGDGADATSEPQQGTAMETAYRNKIAELEEANGEELASATIGCGSGEKVLVITKRSAVYAGDEAIDADVYQYVDGEVRYIASVSSSGTAYPIAYTKDAILFGGSHTSGKLEIADGAGTLYRATDLNIEGRTPLLEICDVANGEETLRSSEEIPADDADAFDYYIDAFANDAAEMIQFQ